MAEGRPHPRPGRLQAGPDHIHEYHCDDLHRPPGRINVVDKARLHGDWMHEDLDETAAVDKRVAAAT